MKILKFNNYNNNSIINSLIENYKSVNSNKVNIYDYDNTLNEVITTLNIKNNALNIISELDFNLILNINNSLVENSNINIDLKKNILSSISLILILQLNDIEKGLFNLKSYDSIESLKTDIKNILEELKLNGIGNGIIKNLISIYDEIYRFFKIILSENKKYNNIKCISELLYDKKTFDLIFIPINNFLKDKNISINDILNSMIYANDNISYFNVSSIIDLISSSEDISDVDIVNNKYNKTNNIINENEI